MPVSQHYKQAWRAESFLTWPEISPDTSCIFRVSTAIAHLKDCRDNEREHAGSTRGARKRVSVVDSLSFLLFPSASQLSLIPGSVS